MMNGMRHLLRSAARPACCGQQWTRCVGGVGQLVAEVETALAGGKLLERGSPMYSQLNAQVHRLRAENDQFVVDVQNLKKARAELVAEEARMIAKIHADGQSGHHGSKIVETLKQIEDLDRQMAMLRSQQVQNVRDVGLLKRQKVTIEKSEEVMKLERQVQEALGQAEPVQEDGPLATSIAEAVQRLRDEFDANSVSSAEAKKDIENAVSRIRSSEMSLRVRRDKADPTSDALRASLISGLYQVRRKNAKLSQMRDMQAFNAQLVGVLQRARHSLSRKAEVQLLVAAGNKEHIKVEINVMLRDIQMLQKVTEELEATQAKHADEGAEVTTKLRGLKTEVTPETGLLRERLIAALREEEFCMARLAVLRNVQAQDVKFLAELEHALAK
mmetsp:Transcript_65738/g.118435  ORF Transcript_65738/g.118435 Transcript_65738/m.118435 type:complete len:387 (+) Transcript_65738:67-1227(+)